MKDLNLLVRLPFKNKKIKKNVVGVHAALGVPMEGLLNRMIPWVP